MKKSLFTNSVFLTLYRVLVIFFPLITSIYVARILSAEGIGKVAFAQNVVSYFVVFACLGIPTYGTREIAKVADNADQKNKVFSELFIINALSTLLCLAVYFTMIFFVEEFRREIVLYCAVSLTLFLNIFNVDWFYQGKEDYVYITIRSFLVKILALLALFLFVKSSDDYVVYALISSLAVGANYIFNIINLRKHVKMTFRDLRILRHIKYIFILFSTSLSVELYTQLDTTMLGFLSGETQVAYYSYAVKLIRVITSIVTVLSTILLPRLSYYGAKGQSEKYVELCNKAFRVVISLSVPAMFGIILTADSLVVLMYGYKFLPVSEILQCMTPLIIILAVGNLFGSLVLVSLHKEIYLFYSTALGAVVNIFLNVFLIPKFAAFGAAFASLISELIVMIIQYVFSKKNVKFYVSYRMIFSILFASVCMCFSVIFVNIFISSSVLDLCVGIPLGIIVYCFVGVRTGNETLQWLIVTTFNRIRSILRKRLIQR